MRSERARRADVKQRAVALARVYVARREPGIAQGFRQRTAVAGQHRAAAGVEVTMSRCKK